MNVLSYSYGKDSGACIHVCIDILKWPIDRIVTADVWATDTIPAVLPEMWEWQCKADEIIKSRYGITVEHVCARNKDGTKKTYEQLFYHIPKRRSQSVQVERERERERDGKTSTQTETDSQEKELIGAVQDLKYLLKTHYEMPLGFPVQKTPFCNSELKTKVFRELQQQLGVKTSRQRIKHFLPAPMGEARYQI